MLKQKVYVEIVSRIFFDFLGGGIMVGMNKNKNVIKEFYYSERNTRTIHAAKEILGIIGNYVTPDSIVDVGGGVGTWIKTAQELFNIKDDNACLLEGDYVSDYLVISKDCFMACNLEEEFRINNKYGLAISLEVAEHLSEKRAETFVRDLIKISDMVLFSAAIPFQGGKGHINERKIEYWIELFKEYDYTPFDIIRPIIQYDNQIDYWYKQNALVFCKKNSSSYDAILNNYSVLPPLSMVSYDLFSEYVRRIFKYPFYAFYQKIKKSYIWKEWVKTRGTTDM